jgi:hypothetical protein
MGWDFSQVGRAQEIEHCKRPWETERYINTLVASSQVGNHLWTVRRNFDKVTQEATEYIDLLLIKKEIIGGAEWWGHKGLSARYHPYYYDCPLAFLGLAPEEDSSDWREWAAKVRQYHADRAARQATIKRLKVGDTVRLVNCRTPECGTIESLGPPIIGFWGRRYRIPPRLIGEIIEEEAA